MSTESGPPKPAQEVAAPAPPSPDQIRAAWQGLSPADLTALTSGKLSIQDVLKRKQASTPAATLAPEPAPGEYKPFVYEGPQSLQRLNEFAARGAAATPAEVPVPTTAAEARPAPAAPATPAAAEPATPTPAAPKTPEPAAPEPEVTPEMTDARNSVQGVIDRPLNPDEDMDALMREIVEKSKNKGDEWADNEPTRGWVQKAAEGVKIEAAKAKKTEAAPAAGSGESAATIASKAEKLMADVAAGRLSLADAMKKLREPEPAPKPLPGPTEAEKLTQQVNEAYQKLKNAKDISKPLSFADRYTQEMEVQKQLEGILGLSGDDTIEAVDTEVSELGDSYQYLNFRDNTLKYPTPESIALIDSLMSGAEPEVTEAWAMHKLALAAPASPENTPLKEGAYNKLGEALDKVAGNRGEHNAKTKTQMDALAAYNAYVQTHDAVDPEEYKAAYAAMMRTTVVAVRESKAFTKKEKEYFEGLVGKATDVDLMPRDASHSSSWFKKKNPLFLQL